MAAKRALEGLKVIDLTWVAAGPTITTYLADQGATVIRLESHTRFDVYSRLASPFKDGTPGMDRSGFFTAHNASKYSATLDLAKPKGKEVFWKFIMWADVLTESMTPGTMKKLGFDYESVSKVKPDIVYLSFSVYGQYGPWASGPGFGQLASSMAGLFHLGGWPDRAPAPPYGAYTDYVAPPFTAAAILAALDYRRRTGKGQYIDVALTESSLHFAAPVVMDYMINGRVMNRNGNRISRAAPHGVFPCQGDDRWCAIGIFNDDEWQGLCQAMGDPAWAKGPKFADFLSRKKNEDELETLIAEWTSNHKAEEVASQLQAAGVPCSVVETTQDLFEDSQLKHRDHIRWLDHPVMGKHIHRRPAFKLSKTPDQPAAAPTLGQHNEYVYKELLGLSDEEIADLLAERVITTEADLPW